MVIDKNIKMPTRRKGYFTYGGRLQSITDIMKEHGVSEFLQRNGPMKEGPQRNKLRRLLKVNGITKEGVDAYLQEEIQNNRDPYIILPRQRGSIVINGEQMTARQVLNRFPLLSGYLQQKRPLNEKALHAKVLREFRAVGFPIILHMTNRHNSICTVIILAVQESVINSMIRA